MKCHFILVNPARSENVGFTARAIKTMGFTSLRIVGENLHETEIAKKTGYGAHDILDGAEVYSSLGQALQGLDLIVGTTSKRRIKRYDYHTPGQIKTILESKPGILKNVGLVFGSEENGLDTRDLDKCDLLSTIPMVTGYPSLNLAQSVLIYAWELSKQELFKSVDQPKARLQGLLKTEANALLEQLGIHHKPILLQRILDRLMLLNAGDTELLVAILKKLKRSGGS